MAQLKDLIVAGASRFIGDAYANELQLTSLSAPTAAGGTTYSLGTSGQYLRTNGNSLYWDTLAASDIPNISADKITSGTLPVARGGTGLTASPSLLVNLASTSAANVLQASPRPGVTGTLGTGNGGTGNTSFTASRLVYSNTATKLASTSITSDGDYLGSVSYLTINEAHQTDFRFKVSGTAYFHHSGNSASRSLINGTRTSTHLSLGNTGLQTYNNDTASQLYINYYGGAVDIGSSSTASAARNFYGAFDFKSANGFTYSGIAAASADTSRPIWFSYDSVIGRPVYDNDFKYNPNDNFVTINGNGGIQNTTSANTLTIKSVSTLYINSGASASILFQRNGTEVGRWNSSSNLIVGNPSDPNNITDYRLYVNGTSYFNGIVKVTANSNTFSIGSQNSSFNHLYNSANIPFIFNNTILTTTGNLGSTSYPFNNLYIGKTGSKGIYYVGTKVTNQMITFLDNTDDAYGNGIKIGGGGTVVVGSGESAANFSIAAGTESTYILADGVINLESNGDTIANRIGAQITTGGHFIPVKAEAVNTKAQDLGSTTAMWRNLYLGNAGECGIEVDNTQSSNPNKIAFIVGTSGKGGIYSRKHSKWIVYSDASGNIALDGNAATATAFSSGTTVALTGDTTGTSASSTKGWSVPTTTSKLSFLNGRIESANLDISTIRSKMVLTLASSSMTTQKPPQGDGYIVTYGWDNAYWGAQHAISHTKTPHMSIRGTSGSSSNDWGNWIYLLDANNYTDYTVEKDGTGASGSWGINITGNAATATALTSNAGNISKPIYFSGGKPVATSGWAIEYIEGTQTAATGSWTGVTKDASLEKGKVIVYKLPYNGSGNASLNLTLAGGGTTGAIAIYVSGNTRLTTHYSAGSIITLTYDGTYWRGADYWNSNSRDPGYGKITPGTASTATTGITANTTQITAKTYNEVLTINPGNKWIQLAGSESATAGSDSFTIAHTVPASISNTGPTTAQTPGYGATFNIPVISTDAAGHVTGVSTTTVKIPASDNTDEEVKQTATTTNSENYELLFSSTADNTTRTEGARKTNKIKCNPSTGNITSGLLTVTTNIGTAAPTSSTAHPATGALYFQYANNNNDSPVGASDWIKWYGTSGIWTYRQWASGKAEAWGIQTFSATTATYVKASGTIPSDIMNPSGTKYFYATGNFTGTTDSHIGYAVCNDNNTYEVYLHRSTTNSVTAKITMYVVGGFTI